MRSKRRHPSLKDIAYEEIKGMLFSGKLVQGDNIIIDEIARTITEHYTNKVFPIK